MMRLLLVELDAAGHHLVLYTRLLLREAISRGWTVTILTTKSSRNHPAFDIIAADHDVALQTIVIPDVRYETTSLVALAASHLRLWRALANACSANNHFADFDLIYCINLDYFGNALSLRGSPFGSKPFAGMLMNPKFHRASVGLGPNSRGDFLYRVLFRRVLALCDLKRIMVIDRPFWEFCRKQHFTHVEKLCLVSDVGELSRSAFSGPARNGLALPSDAFVILLYGSVSRLKGVEELLRSVQRLNDPEIVALVAGKPVPEVEALFSERRFLAMQESGQLVLRAEFQDDAAEAKLFAAADLVWLGYVGGAYGSSGVLYQAGAAGLPVIAMADGLIGWMVRKHRLGVTVDPTDTAAVVDVIRGLREEEETMRQYGENGRRLAKRHTGAAFAETICDALAAANRDHA